MEWGKTTTTGETWKTITLENTYTNPIVVATNQYQSTTTDYGIATQITNVTPTSFKIKNSNINQNNPDNINTHYIVIEQGSWTIPETSLKVQAGQLSTSKFGSSSANWNCPTNGETITFTENFNSNPLIMSTRGSNNNPSIFLATFQHDPTSTSDTVTTSQMCIGLSRSRGSSVTITNPETIYWIGVDQGSGFINGIEFETLWNLKDTGTSGGNWINGYDDSSHSLKTGLTLGQTLQKS